MRARKPAVAFQLYPAEHLARTADLTAEELGLVTRLTCFEWLRGPLPDEPQRLARLCQVSAADLKRCWSAIERHFPRDAQGKRQCAWLEDYRRELEEWRSRQADGGRLGAERRWHRMGHPCRTQSVRMALLLLLLLRLPLHLQLERRKKVSRGSIGKHRLNFPRRWTTRDEDLPL